MSHIAVSAATACRNCGAGLQGEYCHGCGEPRPHDHEYQWKHMVHDATHEFLHLDGKIFRTLWLLITRAGLLTEEYWAGRRTPYIRPLRLFIVIAAVHLIAVHSLYSMDLFATIPYGHVFTRFIQHTAESAHTSPAQVREALNLHLTKAYSLGQYISVLGFALLPWALYRKRNPHYAKHLIYALHIYSFYFLLRAAVAPFLTAEIWLRAPLPLFTFAYIAFSLRRLYEQSWWVALGKAVLVRVGLAMAEALALLMAVGYAMYRVQGPH